MVMFWQVCSARFLVHGQEIEMADFEDDGKLVDRQNGWIASPVLEATQILLAEPGQQGELFLRQSLCPTQARKVSADQFAHVHASLMAGWRNEVYQL